MWRICYKRSCMARPRLKQPAKQVITYLSQEQLDDIEALVGNQYRSNFIREAVNAKIKHEKNKQKKKITEK